jgi:hypothetical protein
MMGSKFVFQMRLYRFYTQVSHHPPVTAFHSECDGGAVQFEFSA